MLQIQNIKKKFVTGDLTQVALDGVSLNLRDNEFVAILGPSGSGKTTLLNIIGGLDRYDSGDLIINGISTKKYKDRDWDSYRNHTIGFVFQSYNLIPHQTVLSNVELALTISGVSRKERRRRAIEALERVGLGEQIHKHPNQMSGGQMQRVAIARALVNDPDILLADEPTGALDTETSIQVMDLLKEVAKDRLVVMVTHNPELAEQYATRIVRLKDGKILGDTMPYDVAEEKLAPPEHKNMGKSSMSFWTSLALSFNNLSTKKARTLLIAFAGSIGIIGIALILSLSTGVNDYIANIQKDTMVSYPITIDAQTFDLSSVLSMGKNNTENDDGEASHSLDGVYSDPRDIEMASAMTTSLTENNLTEFKKYLDNPESNIHKHIGENGIVYSYDTKFGVYTFDPDGKFVNTDGSTVDDTRSTMASSMGVMSQMYSSFDNGNFKELLPGQDGELISPAVKESYDVIYGDWPSAYDEVVLEVNRNNEIPASTLYELGMLPSAEYKDVMDKIKAGEDVSVEQKKWSFEEICSTKLYMIPACDTYVKNEFGHYESIGDNMNKMERLADSALQLKIVGIVRSTDDADYDPMTSPFGYTKALTDYIIAYTDRSEVVKAQRADSEHNVINGAQFAPADDEAKIADAKAYLEDMTTEEKANMSRAILTQMYAANPQGAQSIVDMSDTQLAESLDGMLAAGQLDDEALLNIYNGYISPGSYDDNMAAFGVVSLDAPSSVSIYADTFEDKDSISDCIEEYNKTASEENKITYTDYVGLLMSSVTTIINVISYVLIAFVAVSLVVSSIMIGIITYISVLERTKEIGILRAIGASKRNISQVFNAETFIIGLCSGVMGIGITLLLLVPGNAIIHNLTGSMDVNAVLPVGGAVILVVLSVVLTLIGGLIPAKGAANRDPVAALRTE